MKQLILDFGFGILDLLRDSPVERRPGAALRLAPAWNCVNRQSKIENPKSKIAVLLAMLSIHLLGCNVVGPAAYLVEGPPKTDAVHTLADVPTVVYIDDRAGVVPANLRPVIADKISQDLMVKKALTTTIRGQDAMAYANRHERHSDLLSMEEIGKAVGAKQMIYVRMVQFSDTEDGYVPRPLAQCEVRVLDIENRQRVFPPADGDQSAVPVRAATREVDPDLYRTRSGRLKVFESLADETGTAIAKLFYKHETRELGASLQR